VQFLPQNSQLKAPSDWPSTFRNVLTGPLFDLKRRGTCHVMIALQIDQQKLCKRKKYWVKYWGKINFANHL
jgi:hypothetical protein